MGMSTATGVCDTTFSSTIRRTGTINHHGFQNGNGNNNTNGSGVEITVNGSNNGSSQSVVLVEKRWGMVYSKNTFL